MDFGDLPSDAQELIHKVALMNAVRHDGTAQAGPVISALLGDFPALKSEMGDVAPLIHAVVDDINERSVEEQREELLDIDPDALETEDPNTDPLKDVDIPGDADVVTAFPPAPEKHPHIGHAKALFINHLIARRHDGRFILRFEDTNPLSVEDEYYEAMLRDFRWLGVDPDDVVYASDHMDLYHQKCEDLIKAGRAYVADEPAERISKARRNKEAVLSRSNSVEENLALWRGLVRGERDDVVVLYKGDVEAKNSALRDPALMRYRDDEHPRQGRRYTAWPTYDFQTTCLDGEYGVTHRARSKEFELRGELHADLQRAMGYDVTDIYTFARFEVEDAVVSGREIRQGIESGEYDGWDDPQLMTLAALRRRGFQPEAIREFVLDTGLSKNEAKRPVDELYQANYDAVVDDALNALFIEAGTELHHGDDVILVDNDVSHELEPGEAYETWDGHRFRYDGDGEASSAEEGVRVDGVRRDAARRVTIRMPSGTERTGVLFVDGVFKQDQIVRIKGEGFARIDDTTENTLWFGH